MPTDQTWNISGVLAGAYAGRPPQMLTHAWAGTSGVRIAGMKRWRAAGEALCLRVPREHSAGERLPASALSCPRCLQLVERLATTASAPAAGEG